jgi:tetratricopeptide (TPR) repeat protein
VSKRNRNTPAPLSPAKRRAFLAITLTFPVLLFGLLETGLRLLHYGPDLSLFTTEVLHGTTYHVMNPAVKNRYFSKVEFSPSTSPDYFLVPKPGGTFRIFCLGGSTTVGYPYWYNGSFSSFLRDRLHTTFPGSRIEVINVGMTATNSHTVLDVARDLVAYEPDLFIVYDGHNEFYGALGVASRESVGSSRWMTKAYLKLIHWKTFLLLRDAYARVASWFITPSGEEKEAGTMMERLARGQYIPRASPTYVHGLDVFRENLKETRELCARHGIPLILATQVSNLRDLRPFVSEETASADARSSARERIAQARGLEQAGKFGDALDVLRTLLARDSLYATAHYQAGRCLDTLGRKAEALVEYRNARDDDQLRFRASGEFNDELGRAADGTTATTVDMEEVFAGHSRDGIIGNEFIVEHLHPNSRGYFLMAKAYAAEMRRRGLFAPPSAWAERDTVSDEVLWSNRPVTELDERTAQRRTEVLTSGWPFVDQYPQVPAIATRDTLGQFAEALSRGRWNWLRGHESAAEYYAVRGEFEKTKREYRTILNQIPHDLNTYLELAKLCLDLGQLQEMKEVLLASMSIQKTILATRAVADAEMEAGRPESAIPYYEQTMDFPQKPAEQVENGYRLGVAYFRAGMAQKASERMLMVLKIRPDYQPAIDILGRASEQLHPR